LPNSSLRSKKEEGGNSSLRSKNEGEKEGEKAASKENTLPRARQNALLGLLRRLLPKGEFLNDQGKWGKRCLEEPRKVERVIADFTQRLKGGKPIHTSKSALLEDIWKRFA
jgi:hypothetical protein